MDPRSRVCAVLDAAPRVDAKRTYFSLLLHTFAVLWAAFLARLRITGHAPKGPRATDNAHLHTVVQLVVHHLVDGMRFGDALRLCSATNMKWLKQDVIGSAKTCAESACCVKQLTRSFRHANVRIQRIGDAAVVVFSVDELLNELIRHRGINLQWTCDEVRFIGNPKTQAMDEFKLTSTCSLQFSFGLNVTSVFRGIIDAHELFYDVASDDYSIVRRSYPIRTPHRLRMLGGTMHIEKIKDYIDDLYWLIMK